MFVFSLLNTSTQLLKKCFDCFHPFLQHVLEHGKPQERSAIINKLTGQIVQMSQQKFASNVIEKCLSFGTPTERQTLIYEMLGSTDENEPLQVCLLSKYLVLTTVIMWVMLGCPPNVPPKSAP